MPFVVTSCAYKVYRARPKSLHAMRAYYQRVCTSMTLYADGIGNRVTPDGSFGDRLLERREKRNSAGQVRVYWGYLRAMSWQGLASAVAWSTKWREWFTVCCGV